MILWLHNIDFAGGGAVAVVAATRATGGDFFIRPKGLTEQEVIKMLQAFLDKIA